MEPAYRMLIRPLSRTNQIWEWKFTVRDLDFLYYQKTQGVLDKCPDNVLALFIGEVLVHQSDEFSLLPSSEVKPDVVDRILESHPHPSGFRSALTLNNAELASKIMAKLSLDDRELMFTLVAPNDKTLEIPFQALREVVHIVSVNHPGLQDGWFVNQKRPVAIGPDLGQQKWFEVPIKKETIEVSRKKVRVLARSEEEACQKAVRHCHDLEYTPRQIRYSGIGKDLRTER